jgi:glycosyltransferase involved in cell wall biosynthesis
MKIGIAGPISTQSIARFISGDISSLPLVDGASPLLGTLIGELLSRGHEVSAYTTTTNLPLNLPQPVIAQGDRFKIYYCPQRKHSIRMNGWHLGRIVDFFGLERRYLEQAIRMDKPDVVHAHWAYEFALAVIASGKSHVVTCHDAPQEVLKYMPNLYRLGRFFMAHKAMRTAQCLTTPSPYMLGKLPKKKIVVIANPLPPFLVCTPIDETRHLSTAEPIVVMAANGWGKLKNAQAGLRAFSMLLAAIPGAKLKLYGADFGSGERAEQWTIQQGITKNMEFVGRLPYTTLMQEIAKGDIFLHPSREEAFGMVVAEAMALGVPVIGGRNSGAVPWVIGENGLLVDVENDVDITNALITVLTDSEKWQRLRVAAYQSSQSRFSPSVIADAYIAVYRELVANK